MCDGKAHTMYSMRRSIAQEAYDKHLAQDYLADDESDDEPEPPTIIKQAGGRLGKRRRVENDALIEAGKKLHHVPGSRAINCYVLRSKTRLKG